MTPEEARALPKGERVRITAESPALGGREGRVLDAASLLVPATVRLAARNGWRIGTPPFVVVVGGDRAHDTDFAAAVAAEFVERA